MQRRDEAEILEKEDRRMLEVVRKGESCTRQKRRNSNSFFATEYQLCEPRCRHYPEEWNSLEERKLAIWDQSKKSVDECGSRFVT